ncbi:hypothetical protein CM49_02452 [Paenibacillus sp. P1XP2]|nr:hypothetical protein CM49_02452 [Paenibacillus sp. P1XP2]
MPAQSLHKGQPVIERKIRYDATVAYHDCTLLKMELPKIVLLHQVDKPFTMPAAQANSRYRKERIPLLIIGSIGLITCIFGETAKGTISARILIW